jgi:indole-3-glycerol phosphate synthase
VAVVDFLDRMSQASRRRVTEARSKEHRARLRKRALGTLPPRPLRLRGTGFDLIAEVKRTSPSVGKPAGKVARLDGFAARQASAYIKAGAVAISVLTEPDEFGGSLSDLNEVARTASVPVMRKDFLVDPYQVLEARAAGAAGVLLILRLLDQPRLSEMLGAAREMRLFVLLEAFDREDLERAGEVARWARSLGVTALVGLNCRDLATLEIDRERFRTLRPAMPDRVPAVAESGLLSPENAHEVASLGYRLALVGGALMRARDPVRMIERMLAAGRQGVRACASG